MQGIESQSSVAREGGKGVDEKTYTMKVAEGSGE